MKITNDILKDYFYDKCSHEEEIEIQKWLTENDNNLMDQSFREIISEIQIEDHELSQKAFQKFQKSYSTQTGSHTTPKASALNPLDAACSSRPFYTTFVFSRIFTS